MEPLIFEADEIILCDDKSKWFNYYVPQIPTNYIIHKTITGLGATTTEIKADRNSIIVLPNVATILNKQESHWESDHTFAVYEGVSTKHIVSYLSTDTPRKKLLTTPESLKKILKAFINCKIKGFEDYFILLDECQRYIQDIDYRPNITIAIDAFFKFEGKAMVSSTPIKPSDPRFKMFKHLKLQPTYKYAKPVELLFHNNVINAIKNSFDRYPEVNQCVFFNSINGIISVIKTLEIIDDSVVFCSKESSDYLTKEVSKEKHFNAAFKFEPNSMKKYNFFTSSLFNGLDIILDEPPHVIMVSVPNDPKTFLDPFTDVIQILGRFRRHKLNADGDFVEPIYADPIHLLSSFSSVDYRLKQEVRTWLLANQHVYDTILTLMYSNPNQTEKELYREAMRRLPFHQLVANEYHFHRNNPSTPNFPDQENPDLYNLNYFKIDNLYEEERVNSYYGFNANLAEAYNQAGIDLNIPDVKSFEVYYNERVFEVDEQPKLNLRGGKRYSKENVKRITQKLEELDSIGGNLEEYDEAVFTITSKYSLVRKAFHKLGREKIKELDYNIGKIKQALIDYDVAHGKNSEPIIDSVYLKFTTNVKIPLTKIKTDLQAIYNHYEIPATAKATDIGQWFEFKETKIISFNKDSTLKGNPKVRTEHRAYILLKRKFNIHKNFGDT